MMRSLCVNQVHGWAAHGHIEKGPDVWLNLSIVWVHAVKIKCLVSVNCNGHSCIVLASKHCKSIETVSSGFSMLFSKTPSTLCSV